ncbi:SAM hydrolase/SAM-dependent halogenase family protein [Anthocerotibacter panamensis]|uniref:SAM hydrolase/SAM-dependent halogenase family protein n=1 Tax=Anthocerotibacter panamensis TaxID=2857077 RepID=UPI001C403492|nr:SAM-dependent chlorinase/fluorinase [Anthocerotibacter panamensis]
MLIHLIADYGTGDPAFAEVTQQLLVALPGARVSWVSVPPFSTLATGFWIAQLGLNRGPTNRVIYHNCAPRQDDLDARWDNEGERLTYARLPNGVLVIGVNSGYSLSFIKEHAGAMYGVSVARGGSQFRSRDIFPPAVASLAQGDFSLLGAALEPEVIPDVPPNRVAWIDGYGNLKTTIPATAVALPPQTRVVLRVGDTVSDAVYSDGSFKVPEGTLAFAPGSSGWSHRGTKVLWMELFLRGGSAWERFNRPRINQTVSWSL